MSRTMTGLNIPVRTTDPQPVDVNQVEIYSKNGKVYSIDHNGTVVELTNAAGVVGSHPLFIQDTQPNYNGKYLWIQTNIGGDPNDFSFLFEDGL